ncbi:MAG TPA: quaternary ammonium compound efflux SMR transporter SugE [Chlamydiales bacterium]|nr:quaternary ammonium compound efflux SMR transporter SugE [Chlamydiales bacterium]
MHWTALILAGLFEIVWAVCLKYTQGFSKLVPSLFTIGAMVASTWLLCYAVKELPIGTAYAVWTGIGAVGVVLIGMFFLGEPKDLIRIACIFLIITSIVVLKLTYK